MKPGRPRIVDSQAVRQVMVNLVQGGTRTFTVPVLVSELRSRLGLSRASAYRILHRAHDEGVVRIPPFDTPAYGVKKRDV
jgi:hypothetical protein